ncbi:MAG: hypothetical protein ACRDN0_33810 [Trebonia sp.]
MNTQLTSELAVRHIHDLQCAAAQRRRDPDLPAERSAAPAMVREHQRSPFRRQIGFTLIEAGLRLVSGPTHT